MQLKLDRSEFEERGFFSKSIKYKLHTALLVTPDEVVAIKRLGFWKETVRPLRREENGDYDLEVMNLKSFADLVNGFTITGTLPFIEEMERDIVDRCKFLKHHIEGGSPGERIIDI